MGRDSWAGISDRGALVCVLFVAERYDAGGMFEVTVDKQGEAVGK